MSPILISLIAVVAIVLLWLVFTYNKLVRLNIHCDEASSDIDTQTKRRYDLIPNLVESVKGYEKHEKDLLEAVTKARTQAMQAKGMQEKAIAENALSNTLTTLLASVEAYPDLKASQNFLDLQTQLTDTENKIEASRRYYNGNVREFNIKIKTFPSVLVAGMLGFKTARPLFEALGAEREAVKVKF